MADIFKLIKPNLHVTFLSWKMDAENLDPGNWFV